MDLPFLTTVHNCKKIDCFNGGFWPIRVDFTFKLVSSCLLPDTDFSEKIYSALQKLLNKIKTTLIIISKKCFNLKCPLQTIWIENQAKRTVGPDLRSILFDTQHQCLLKTGCIA